MVLVCTNKFSSKERPPPPRSGDSSNQGLHPISFRASLSSVAVSVPIIEMAEDPTEGPGALATMVKNLQKDDDQSKRQIMLLILESDCLINVSDEYSRTRSFLPQPCNFLSNSGLLCDVVALYYAAYIGDFELTLFLLACGATFTNSEIWSTSNDHVKSLFKSWANSARYFPWGTAAAAPFSGFSQRPVLI